MSNSENILVYTVKDRCRVCYTCVRECPVKAIKIVNGQAEVMPERCIACGNCVNICSQGAKTFSKQINKIDELLVGGSKVIAAVAPSFPAEFTELSDYREFPGMLKALGFDKVIEVNLKSVFNMTKASLRTFLKQRNGSIINMSSIVGVQGNAGQSNYSASKAGIIGFSKSIAQELGSRSIRCNVIAPGFIKTAMTDKLDEKFKEAIISKIPSARLGEPDDIANAVLFLCSDQSSYINGETLHVNGGMYMA